MITSEIPTLYAILVIILTIFVFDSRVTLSANYDHHTGQPPAPAPAARQPYKFVNKFCKGRSTSESREFCFKVLKRDPRSAAAKDTTDLLFIALDAAVGNLRPTDKYLKDCLKKATGKPLLAALNECTYDYHVSITELLLVPKDMMDDPALAGYDAEQAYDAMEGCTHAFKENKITDAPILSRHNVSFAYVNLALEVANLVN